MKKRHILLLVLAASLFLCSCGKSEAAAAADEQIAAIGEITLESEGDIEAAEAAVNALEEKDRKSLDNLPLLESARAEYERLAEEKALADIAEVEAAISAIGEVSADSAESIAAARAAYDGCDSAIQERVSNAETLFAAEETYAELTARAAAEKVSAQIDAIGEVSLESGDILAEARTAYDALDDRAKALVSSRDTLVSAESAYSELKAAEREAMIHRLLKKMTVKEDRFQGSAFYYHTTAPAYCDIRSCIIPYIGRQGDEYTWLCWYLDYTGDDWVFWDTVIFVVDGKTYRKDVGYNNVSRDNAWGTVWETYTSSATSESDKELFRSIAASEETLVRFSGKYNYDMTVSTQDKQAIADIMALYDAWTKE